jgi:uncharacterized protein YodC (DUF2158 family)
MMEDSFVVGDQVQLKSGGHAMTIEEIDGNNISCVWFEGKTLHRDSFVSATLKRYVRPAVGVRLTRG